jgi:hypothetical protein
MVAQIIRVAGIPPRSRPILKIAEQSPKDYETPNLPACNQLHELANRPSIACRDYSHPRPGSGAPRETPHARLRAVEKVSPRSMFRKFWQNAIVE